MRVFFVTFLFCFALTAKAESPIYVIGDLHGDYLAMVDILSGMGLVDSELNWAGGKSRVVIMGDLLNRGAEGRKIMDLAMQLEGESLAAGGEFHSIMGNHELYMLVGQLGSMSKEDKKSYSDYSREGDTSLDDAVMRAFKGETKYAKWFRTRPSMLVLDDHLFVHGGLSPSMEGLSLDNINAMVMDWIKFFQNKSSKPSKKTKWVLGGNGPLNSRWLEPDAGDMEFSLVEKLLVQYDVNQIFVGHMPVEKIHTMIYHPDFDGRVFLTDSGISSAVFGKATVSKISKGKLEIYRIKDGADVVTLKQSRTLLSNLCEDNFK